MSRVFISKSYAILMGMEGYTRAKRKLKDVETSLQDEKNRILHPEKGRLEKELQKDRSQSAEIERQPLDKQRMEEQPKQQSNNEDESSCYRFARKLRFGGKTADNKETGKSELKDIAGVSPKEGLPLSERGR